MVKKNETDGVDTESVGGMSHFEYSVFFRGPEGFGEHLKAVAVTAGDIGAARMALLSQLLMIEAKPAIKDIEYKRAEAAKLDPTVKQWARKDNGAPSGGGMECKNGCGPMKVIQNTQHKTGRNGKVWTDFAACDTCKATKNFKTIGGEQPGDDD